MKCEHCKEEIGNYDYTKEIDGKIYCYKCTKLDIFGICSNCGDGINAHEYERYKKVTKKGVVLYCWYCEDLPLKIESPLEILILHGFKRIIQAINDIELECNCGRD